MLRQKPLAYILLLVSLAIYYVLGYEVQRYDSSILLPLFGLLFIAYVWIWRKAEENNISFWIYASILFRLSLLFALPSLSDDFYRFIWDGRLIANGIHPFAELPGYYLEHSRAIPGINQELFDQLNSKQYFTIYPPLAQFTFWISVLVFPNSIIGSVVVMRLFILAAEVGSIFLISRLLTKFNISQKSVLIYALNPLVILELTGNLHFEAIVIFFLLLAFYFLSQTKLWQAGISLGLSIGAKLLPLIFLPLFLIRLGLGRAILFYAVIVVTMVLLFIPLLDVEVFSGFIQSFELYFKNFEFNASIYYLVREYGFMTKGYNTIQSVGWKLGVLSAIGILIISLWPYTIRKIGSKWRLKLKINSFPSEVAKLPKVMMWVMLFYFLMTTTLHPWYITTLLMLSIFTQYRFVILWTGLIFLTYIGYSIQGFSENLYLIALEYIIVIGYLVYELKWKRVYLSQ